MKYMMTKKAAGLAVYVMLLSLFVACSKNFKQEKDVLISIVDKYFHNIDSSTAQSYEMDVNFDPELTDHTKQHLREWIDRQDTLSAMQQEMLKTLLEEDQQKLTIRTHELSESTLYKLTNADSTTQGNYKVGFNKLALLPEEDMACTIIDKQLGSGEQGMPDKGAVEVVFFNKANNEWSVTDTYVLQSKNM